ncbi:MAG: CoA-transferase [Candidatus Caldarchaeum sp.]
MMRKNKITTFEDALQHVKDGCRVAIGGFQLASRPMTLLRMVMKNHISGLTVVSPPSGLDVDMLIAAGVVKRIITSYVGGETIAGIGPVFRRAVENNEIDVREYDTGMLIAALRAESEGLPFAPWRGGLGTSIQQVNPDLKTFTDPITGSRLLAVPALSADVALIHASLADEYGNIQHLSHPLLDRLIASASKKVIVEVEKIVSNEYIRAHYWRTSIPNYMVEAVVVTPYGAHPTSSPGFYTTDIEHLAHEYVPAANAWLKGDQEPLKRYLSKYVYGPKDHWEYLQLIGFEKLFSLGSIYHDSV